MTRTRLDDLPLFADDAAIGRALLGPQRAEQWRDLAALYERRPGFPRVDDVMGGRYVPALRAFFDHQYGLAAAPQRSDGVERPDLWNAKGGRLRRA